MKATLYHIDEKHRRDVGYVAGIEDFTLSRQGEIDAALIATDPTISLYCFDETQRQALFVQLPAHIDLTLEPFVYQSQYEYAERAYTLPLASFNALAKTLPAVARPIFVHITGRSGSTLLNHALNESGLVKSLAEPDVVSQFAALRHAAPNFHEHELTELAESTVRFLFKAHHGPDIQAHAIKFRNQGTLVMDIFQAAFPQGKNLFLYRNVVDFVASFQRILRRAGLPEHFPFTVWRSEFQAYLAGDLTHMSRYVGGEQAVVSIAEQLTLWWLAVIEWYVAQREQGIPALSVSYAELVATKAETLSAIFRYCGLPTSSVDDGLRAYERDSQAGTVMARENPAQVNSQHLTPAELAAVQAIIERHPLVGKPGFAMP